MMFLLITNITVLSHRRQLSSTNSSIWILLVFHLLFLHFMIIYILYGILLKHVRLISFYQNWWENFKISQQLRKHGPLARLTSVWTLVQYPWTSGITSLALGLLRAKWDDLSCRTVWGFEISCSRPCAE